MRGRVSGERGDRARERAAGARPEPVARRRSGSTRARGGARCGGGTGAPGPTPGGRRGGCEVAPAGGSAAQTAAVVAADPGPRNGANVPRGTAGRRDGAKVSRGTATKASQPDARSRILPSTARSTRPGGNLLKKGRGLRKHTKGGPEEAETPVEASETSGATSPAAAVATEEAEPEPPALAASETRGDADSPSESNPAVDLVEIVEVPETAEAFEVAEGPANAVSAESLPAAELDEDEPPPPARAVTVPEGPVLETAKLPDIADEPATANPLTLPRVVAIANQKGGVGKTTTTVNLGASLAELGFRVLVLDLDPQGNATTGLGLNPRDVEGSVYDVLLNDVALEDIVEPTSLKNLFVAPATIDLAGAEIELVPVMSRELKLRKAIDQIRDQYDLVLIDCPPSLGLLTVNGLAASDDVIVPIQCEYYALEGLGQLLRNVGLVQANLNPALDIRGIILTMYDARTKLADQVVTEVRAYFGEKVYETVVPRTVRLSEAPSFGQPIIVFDSTSRGATAYRDLAKEVSRGATGRAG